MGTAPHDGRPTVGSSEVACAHYPDCVGCPLVGTAYGAQLRAKEVALRAELAGRQPLLDVEPERIFGSPLPFGYRNQAKLVLRRRRAPGGRSEVVLGVYRPGTHSVMPAERCRVHDRRLLPFLVALRARIEESGIPIYDERRREGVLRYALEAVFLCLNPTPGNSVLSPEIRRVFGPRSLVEHFGRLSLESRPDAFVQANPGVATRIYSEAERWLEPNSEDVVLDLFGGVGGFGLALAGRVAMVLGIESSPAAVECANGNAKRAHLRHVRYLAAQAEEAPALAREHGLAPAGAGALRVVVNPPRGGLSESARSAVVDLDPTSPATWKTSPRGAFDCVACGRSTCSRRRPTWRFSRSSNGQPERDGSPPPRPESTHRPLHQAVSTSPLRRRCAIRICCTSEDPS